MYHKKRTTGKKKSPITNGSNKFREICSSPAESWCVDDKINYEMLYMIHSKSQLFVNESGRGDPFNKLIIVPFEKWHHTAIVESFAVLPSPIHLYRMDDVPDILRLTNVQPKTRHRMNGWLGGWGPFECYLRPICQFNTIWHLIAE